jgi:hypothetical protein
MTLATSAFSTYSAIGNREDLSDIIYRIDPTDTPFYSGIDRETATATNHEWQTQALAAPSTANAQLEGDDNAAATSSIPSFRCGNISQIQIKIPRVTGTQRAVIHAGRADEMDYQVMLNGLGLKRDVESTLLNNQKKLAGNETTARNLAGIGSWITSNTDKAAGGADPTNADGTHADGTGTRTDGTQRGYTESSLKNVLQKIWTNGGKPDVIMMGAFNKQVFSTFTGRGTPIENQETMTITAAADTYKSDFGVLRAIPNRFQRPRDVLVLQMDMWADSPLPGRNMVSFPLAKTGDTDRRQLLIEHTLVARNEKASGGVFDLTTS